MKKELLIQLLKKTRESRDPLKAGDYCAMLFFLSLCGNNLFNEYLPKAIFPATAFCMVIYYFLEKTVQERVKKESMDGIYIMVGGFLAIFSIQFIIFGWNTVPGLINHLSKFIIGAGIASYYGSQFRELFFKTMFYLCLISIPLWILQLVLGGLPGIPWSLGKTIWIYSYRQSDDILRNCGFFWEPGAMGGYIVFLFTLYFNDLKQLLKKHKLECAVILLTLLTTQSTGAYMSFSAFLILYFLFSMKSAFRFAILPVFVFAAVFAYSRLEFMEEKVTRQNESSENQEIGDYSSTRLGTIIFDLYYIAKHPIVGNGLHERTRMIDHPEIAQALLDGDLQGLGNGFSDTLVKWGLAYYIIFGIVFWRTNRHISSGKKICIYIVLLVILQGECFLNYPLFLGFPLIQLGGKEKKNVQDRLRIIKAYLKLKQHESSLVVSNTSTT